MLAFSGKVIHSCKFPATWTVYQCQACNGQLLQVCTCTSKMLQHCAVCWQYVIHSCYTCAYEQARCCSIMQSIDSIHSMHKLHKRHTNHGSQGQASVEAGVRRASGVIINWFMLRLPAILICLSERGFIISLSLRAQTANKAVRPIELLYEQSMVMRHHMVNALHLTLCSQK